MVLITKEDNEVLTKRKDERICYKKLQRPENKLDFVTLEKGDGKNFPKTGDIAEVDYIGTFLDGAEFDSSVRSGKTFKFKVNQGSVIKGWDECLQKMSIG